MDLETFKTPLIFASLFSIASIILTFVYKFGMKEKSYEEALAEQRQSTQNLLGIKFNKPKEKKPKKINKKIKETTIIAKGISEVIEVKQKQDNKVKVKNNDEGVKEKPLTKIPVKEKIVQKKEEPKPVIKKEELIKPKKEEHQEVPTKIEEKLIKPTIKNDNETEKIHVDKIPVLTKAPLKNGFVSNINKDKKKKKNELNAIQQLTAAPGGPGMAFILNMVHKAELSHPDIQILIDLLLNKQHDTPSVLEDWSEGKSDPVQKLKKQLAEKEKALTDEQETLSGVQIKLKEIRNEQLTERNNLNQKIKLLEEQLQNYQIEIHSVNNRYHGQGQQLQQLQIQLNDERIKMHNLREELNAVQLQRQQLEIHITQESEVMIAQLRNELQEFSSRNDQLSIEIDHIRKVAIEKEATMVTQLNNTTQALNEKTRQLNELTNNSETLYRAEKEINTKFIQLKELYHEQKEELDKNEKQKNELLDELTNLKKQKDISNNVIQQLKKEIEKLHEDNKKQEIIIENNKINETDLFNLKNELSSLKNKQESNENCLKTDLDNKIKLLNKLEKELEEQKVKNNELRNKNYKIVEALNDAESKLKNGQLENKNESLNKEKEIENQKKFLLRLLPEVNGIDVISNDKWDEECLNLVSNYLESLKKQVLNDSTENLQARIVHYQKVIKDTEGMLNKLQGHIDQEQISWKAQIKSKDLELDALKEKLEKGQNSNFNGTSTVEGQ